MNKLLIIISLSLNVLFAQEELQLPLLDIQSKKYDSSLEKLYKERSIIRTTVPQVLESELDPELYIVGPGDIFKTAIFGELENEFEFTVLPSGTVLIPTVGEIDISRLNLKDAKEKLIQKIKENYIRADVSVNLSGLRKFRVYYTGEVRAPGTYFAQGSDRLSDIIEISAVKETRVLQNDKSIEKAQSIGEWGDNTNIKITHKDSTINYYDITRFYRRGDTSQNPYLHGGDIIFIPPIDLTKSYVVVHGNVESQGIQQLRSNENLLSFLRRMAALSNKTDLRNLVLIRNNEKTKINILSDIDRYKNFFLESQDTLYITLLNENVYVKGEVLYPGAYPYKANYTAKDYAGEAGGTGSAEDIDDIYVFRQSTGEILYGADVIVERGDVVVLSKRTREILKDYVSILAPLVQVGIYAIFVLSQ